MMSRITRSQKLWITTAAAAACLLPLHPSRASGGGGVGNGGGSWTCRANTPGHELIWVDLVDLSEGRRQWGLNIPSIDFTLGNRLTMDQFLAQAEERMKQANPAFFAMYQPFAADVKRRFFLPTDSDFVPTDDILAALIPSAATCPDGTIAQRPEQLANFTPLGQLLVNPILWNSDKFTHMGQAALMVHEAIYWMLRQPSMGGDPDSRRTRELVGYLFSDAPVDTFKSAFPTPSGVTTPLPASQPKAGMYAELFGNMADIEITYFDPHKMQLMLTERDRDNGERAMSSSVFQCAANESELACKMITSNSRVKRRRGFDKYQLRITASDSFVWLTQLPDGSTRVTRYRWNR